MKVNIIIILVVLFSSCKNKQAIENLDKRETKEVNVTAAEGQKLMAENCYACHSVATKSHDEIIAPPMIAVKKRYSMEYNNKADFVKAVVAYATDPKAENALMIGALNKFNTMPKQAFNEEDLNKIASYIYENEIEKPEWFETHFRQNHGKGMGRN
ncbi:c-type cytochrome [Flavobacterium degerlachei]|jgi:mono/diheme cytochrome c family protein|uniref:Cytochrome c n=1 Tax=Flavobacterium degerlachei TaxID=229203 RepID=A0A1H2Z7N2_9FLAO|nr:cytochrome c [Flavobacterium degerlachei]SDX13337.1 Cytochrome c [Flavobacterium degerlachei]